jgi:chemotaxis protein CheC
MTRTPCLEATRIGLLRQIFASATHDASAVMCRWTNSLIRLTVDEVRELPLEDACRALGIGDELLTMVVLNLEGDVGGTMVLTFDEDNGRRLAASLAGSAAAAGRDWSELEKSALTETGNILGCAYVNAITRLIDRQLVPSAPYFIQDYGASVLQQAMVVQAAAADSVLICRTGFQHEGEELNWLLLFVPTIALRTAMENALDDTI